MTRPELKLEPGSRYPEGIRRLTDGSDDCGCKNHCVGPVPVVEGLVACDGHALSCSIRYHLKRETMKVREEARLTDAF